MRKSRVLVNTKDDSTFNGILWVKRGPVVVLRNAQLLRDGQAIVMDGEVIVERRNVSYYQRLL